MKRLLLALIIVMALCRGSLADQLTNVIYGNVGDYRLSPVKKVTVTLTLTYPNPRLVGNTAVRTDDISTMTDTNGYFAFTNLQWGYYTMTVSGRVGTTFPYFVAPDSQGNIAFGSLIPPHSPQPPNPASNYYTKADIDAMIAGIPFVTQLFAGDNVTLSPLNGLGGVTISSSGGGGGSGNMTGPNSSSISNLVIFNNLLGTVTKDSGIPLASIALNAYVAGVSNLWMGGSNYFQTQLAALPPMPAAPSSGQTNMLTFRSDSSIGGVNVTNFQTVAQAGAELQASNAAYQAQFNAKADSIGATVSNVTIKSSSSGGFFPILDADGNFYKGSGPHNGSLTFDTAGQIWWPSQQPFIDSSGNMYNSSGGLIYDAGTGFDGTRIQAGSITSSKLVSPLSISGSGITNLINGSTLTGTNLTLSFNGSEQMFTITNGPDIFFSAPLAGFGHTGFLFKPTGRDHVTLHWAYDIDFYPGATNNLATNGSTLWVDCWNNTNRGYLKASIINP